MTKPPTPFLALAAELRSAADAGARTNEAFEEFLARCDPKDVGSLPLHLEEHRRAAERLAEVYHLLRDLMPFEAEVRAIAARGVPPAGNAAPASATVIVDRDNSVLEDGHSAAV